MISQGMTHQNLCDCLSAIAPCDLMGMALLRQSQSSSCPDAVPREQLREAVIEIIAYTGRCAAAVKRLDDLSAVPLRTVIIGEFGL